MSRVTEDLDHATHRRRHVAHLDRRKARTRISDRHWIRTDLDRPASVRLRLVETGRADQDAKVLEARASPVKLPGQFSVQPTKSTAIAAAPRLWCPDIDGGSWTMPNRHF